MGDKAAGGEDVFAVVTRALVTMGFREREAARAMVEVRTWVDEHHHETPTLEALLRRALVILAAACRAGK